ncbi:MAG: hypothetical protein EA402_13515 [Planctomycetota bacterium]|nr:MAG: hypothetical protein EA402_13515 [Planctomycetota bacterium]
MTNPFHTHCPAACAEIEQGTDGRWIIRPDAPAHAGGNQWFSLCVGLDATSQALECAIHWLPINAEVAGEYPDNHNFATVLDRCCFLDHGDGRWQRLEKVELIPEGACLRLPSGGPGRRLAVGMPVAPEDLHTVLDLAQASPHAQVRRLGHARRGSPVWALTVSEGDRAQGSIVVQSLQHAQEWGGLRAHAALIGHLLSPAGAALRRRWRWLCYPATNADGLYQGWRGDPMVVDGLNPNRDWGTFTLNEVRLVAEDMLGCLRAGPALAHVVDLHMGWNHRQHPGSAVGVAAPDGDLGPIRPWHQGFAEDLIRRSAFSDGQWEIHRRGRPTFPAWLHGEIGFHGQTLELSRHHWPSADGGWEPPSQAREEAFGIALAESLDAYLSDQAHPALTPNR